MGSCGDRAVGVRGLPDRAQHARRVRESRPRRHRRRERHRHGAAPPARGGGDAARIAGHTRWPARRARAEHRRRHHRRSRGRRRARDVRVPRGERDRERPHALGCAADRRARAHVRSRPVRCRGGPHGVEGARVIEIVGLTKSYGEHRAVDGLDLRIETGELTVLLGPSGAGKTTVLRCINRLIEPTSGRILVDGVDASTLDPVELRRSMGYVIQNVGLFPNMTIRENVAAVPRLLGWDKKRTAERVEEMLDAVGLDPARYGPKYPRQLSGGEAQRVGVARALAADPPVLLMDEPFGAVDPLTRERLQKLMRDLQRRLKKTVVFVTHDIDEAVLLADRIALMRDGRLEQHDTPEAMWRRPANEFVSRFFGENLGLRVIIRHCLADVRLKPLPDGAPDLPRIDAGVSLKEALAELVGRRARALVVVRDGSPVGLFDFDVLVESLAEESACDAR
ncbi:ABC-type proline/glycine betaine transport systems, ATPase components [Coriobacteriaceae bacterium EMTCatB1]|nr:ABC-type proline/glycine betaine transport systems, ATPase components [Coriobacteriaceae bacterium EMTCatB1]